MAQKIKLALKTLAEMMAAFNAFSPPSICWCSSAGKRTLSLGFFVCSKSPRKTGARW